MVNELLMMRKLEDILARVETPAYVLDLDKVYDNIQIIRNSVPYPNFQIHYAMFSNDNEELLQLIKEEGLGVLVLNENELETALRLGLPKEKIHLTGGTFTRERLANLLKSGVDINLDSLAQLELAGKIAEGSEVGIRIRIYGRETKGAGEGIILQDIERTKEIADKYSLKIVGLQTYIGTNTLDEQKFLESTRLLIGLAPHLYDLRYINLGGGFGIPYSSKDKNFDWTTLGREISKMFEQIEGNQSDRIQLKIEPGRSIVGNAGYFVAKVIELRDKDTLVVDAPYTNFARPFVYHTNHRVSCIGRMGKDRQFEIRGCTINSNDYFSSPEFEGDSAILPQDIQTGDVLYFRDAGAYSPVMQMDFLHSNKAPTFLIQNDKIKR